MSEFDTIHINNGNKMYDLFLDKWVGGESSWDNIFELSQKELFFFEFL